MNCCKKKNYGTNEEHLPLAEVIALLICPIIILPATGFSSWFESVPVSAEGRVEHQKRNQTATSQWPVGFVFGVQLDYSSRLKSASATNE